MNIKLVKLTHEYKQQLTDMMDEWLAVEQDFSPYAIRKVIIMTLTIIWKIWN